MLVSFSLGNVKFVKLQRTWKVVSHGQIINNYSPKWRWIAVGIYWGKYTPTPRRIIVLVYTIQVNSNSQIVALFSDEMGFARKALCGPREVPFLHYWAAVIVPCDKHTVQTAFQHSNGFPSINYWERRSEYTCSEYTWIETKTDPRWGNEHSWISQGPFLLIDALGAFQSKCQKSRQRKKIRLIENLFHISPASFISHHSRTWPRVDSDGCKRLSKFFLEYLIIRQHSE